MLVRFLIHFLGDIHQPLHCIDLLDELFPQGDQGGNNFFVYFQNNLTKLHSVWDSGIGLYGVKFPRPLSSDDAAAIEQMAQNITDEYPKEHFKDLIHIREPLIWANESYYLAIEYAYQHLSNLSKIDDAYIHDARAIARQRIALGGYRLAEFLKTIPVVTVRRTLSNGQIIIIGAAIFVLGMIIGAALIYITPKKSGSSYSSIN